MFLQTVPALTGQNLLDRLRLLDGLSTAEKAKACGYASRSESGCDRISYKAFYRACAEAAGAPLGEKKAKRKQHQLSYEAGVLTTGAILVGNRYAEQLGLHPGDRVVLEVDGSGIHIKPKN